ncbi:MAG: RNA repair transcriptional activator RtcR family protein [Candidatus Cloacimonadaceae bacterium]
MKKVLLSFIGNNDCYLSEGKEGAIISILKSRPFDALYILFNKESYLEPAYEIKNYCKEHFPNLQVNFEPAVTIDPIDYNLVYPAMYNAVMNIKAKEDPKETEFTVSVTSGTPTMHTCWVLLKQGGMLNAELIQSSREQGVSSISFSLKDFPPLDKAIPMSAQLLMLSRENIALKRIIDYEFEDFIGNCEEIQNIKNQIKMIAKYDVPVYISGESGTGKEVVARLIHRHSSRYQGPFIPVNCGSISENLFESEFFGHKKGSFTGAINDHFGFFEEANGGTLFLDEVADLPLQMQVKLLRVLDSGEITPVGGKVKKVNVRLLTASNKNLQNLVFEGKFRRDLYYRIVNYEIALPPLRTRGTDILLLASHFVELFNKQNNTNKTISPAAEKVLLNQPWQGNVRELRNTIQIACINCKGNVIKPEDIKCNSLTDNPKINEISIPDDGIDLEKEILPLYYHAALNKANGNAAKAARLLKLEPHTFRARLRALGML